MARGDLRVRSIIDTNPKTVALTGNNTVFIKYQSTVEIIMDFAGDAPIDLTTCIIRNGNESQYAALTADGAGVIATFQSIESDTFVIAATDSEGNYINKTVPVEMVEYIKLTCNASAANIDASGKATFMCSGSYFSGSFGAQSNTLRVQYVYRAKDGTWSGAYDMTVTFNGNSYAAIATRSDLDYEKTYEFMFIAEDKFYRRGTNSGDVMSKPIFHWGKNDVTFEKPVCFNDGIEVNEINGNPVAFPEYGTWTPGFSASCEFMKRQGWYSKIGNVVTVGFYMKVNCLSAGVIILVSGLPYTPSTSAAGGGMCSGATVSAGFNFQCFVAETSGFVSTRVQACNNTTSGALATSASGITTATGEITLSGTITYMTN
jgi:hypothetical protein